MMETILCIDGFSFNSMKCQILPGTDGLRNTAAVLMFVSLSDQPLMVLEEVDPDAWDSKC